MSNTESGKMSCGCGSVLSRKGLSQHLNTLKHQLWASYPVLKKFWLHEIKRVSNINCIFGRHVGVKWELAYDNYKMWCRGKKHDPIKEHVFISLSKKNYPLSTNTHCRWEQANF